MDWRNEFSSAWELNDGQPSQIAQEMYSDFNNHGYHTYPSGNYPEPTHYQQAHYQSNYPPLPELPAQTFFSDFRRETNYTDHGHRQEVRPGGITREQFLQHASLSPLDDDKSLLFFPDTSNQSTAASYFNAPDEDLNLTRPSSSRRSRTRVRTETTRSRSASPAREPRDYNNRCTCRIDCSCDVRPANQVDCDPLVPERMNWTDRNDQSSYERHYTTAFAPRGERISITHLGHLHILVQRIEAHSPNNEQENKAIFRDLRQWILDIINGHVTQQDLDASQLITRLESFLSDDNKDMRRIKQVPDWHTEELTVIVRKFKKGDLSFHPKRGLAKKEVHDKNHTKYRITYNLDKQYQFHVPANRFGANNLVNGQLWFSRVELMRDGVHGSRMGGIYGTATSGAYSVVMGLHTKLNIYADIDEGEIIHYQGTALAGDKSTPATNVRDAEQDTRAPNTDTKPTAATQALMTSLKTGKPVRVIRSFRLAKCVTNKPEKGYRYDGLYEVIGQRLRTEPRQCWIFTMRRRSGQGKLRDIEKRGFIHTGGVPEGWSSI